jgi:RNA polymerase sigma factor (sigma-70 family)
MTTCIGGVVRQLHRAALLRDGGGLTDGQLLERFLRQHDEDAFAALVKRHGPMVLGVCRRILGDADDADDAFQATFLVLVRRAAAVQPPEMVANWLYGVACQIARKARARALRRRARERQVAAMPEPHAARTEVWDELRPLLDRELRRLPDRYRAPLVLCDLEGKTRKEAARQLGWPEGTVSGRLSRGRALLARRLSRHGLALSAGALAAALGENTVAACVPAALAASTARAALAGGGLSAHAAALAEGVLKTMLIRKINLTAVFFLTAVLTGLAAQVFLRSAPAQAPAAAAPAPAAKPLRPALEAVPWVLTKVDPARNSVSVRMRTPGHSYNDDDLVFQNLENINTWNEGKAVPGRPVGTRLGIDDLPLARTARVTLDGKEANLAMLKPGMLATLKLAADAPAVARLDAKPPPSGGEAVLKAVDADARTITITLDGKEMTMAVAADAEIFLNTIGKSAFKDLTPGLRVLVLLGVDKDRLAVKRLLGRKEGT